MQMMCISKKLTNSSTLIYPPQMMKNEISESRFVLTASAAVAGI